MSSKKIGQLVAEQVSFRYRKKRILEDVSISIPAGECVGLLGESGIGKTTLGRILSGYELPYAGAVSVNGSPLPKQGYCPVQLIGQHPQLAFDGLMKMGAALKEIGMDPEKHADLLGLIGIKEEWLERFPNELSGGELQRLAIFRVLGEQTQYIIADEISAMLDAITQARLWALLKEIAHERNLGLLVITHNRHLAEKICDRIVQMKDLNKVLY